MQSPSDRILVAQFVERGDEEAFRLLFRRHTPRLFAMSLRLAGGDRGEAEEIVQLTWLRASGGLEQFAWRSSLTTWLTGIVVNCARERRRGRRRDAAPVETLDTMAAPAAPPGLRLDLERAIAALPEGYRDAVVLHDIEGLTHVEVAAALGIAVGTAKSQLFHARRALRRWLGAPVPAGTRHDR